MTQIDEVLLAADVPQRIAVGGATLVLRAQASERRPATVVMEFGAWHVSEPGFADLRFDERSRTLAPFIEMVSMGGSVLAICGIRKWWVVSVSGPLASVELNRDQDDDRGFYVLETYESSHGVLFVYEGGLVMFAPSGAIQWHVHKSWNEVVRGLSSEGVELIDDDGSRIVDLRTGQVLGPS